MRFSPVLAFILICAGTVPAAAVDSGDLSFGGEVRMRGYSLENVWDADSDTDGDKWSVLRQRTRLWAVAELDRDVTAYVRLANQHYGEGVTYPDGWEADNKSDKVFVDAAWVEAPGLFGLPLTLKAGRQDLMYGSGFVLFDGQSQTGSTSAYLDGVRLRWTLGCAGTLDLLSFKDQENSRDDASDDDVTLTGAYLTLANGANAREAYLLRREDQTLDKDIVLAGARLTQTSGPLSLSLEGGLQRGDFDALREHEAWGGTAELGLTPAGAPAGLSLFAGFTGLSGDDPATAGVNERWDVFQGGWPRYGDILAWTNLNLGPNNAASGYDPGYADGSSQGGEAVYGNLMMPSLGLKAAPAAGLSLKAWWSPLRAHRSASGSDDIGDLMQLSARYRWSRELTFAVYAARLAPGAAYGPDPDPMHELYWEIDLDF